MYYLDNLILNTDSYKASHWLQYPPGTEKTFFYVESRGGQYDSTVFFGLQAILKEYLSRTVTHDDVDEACDFFAAHGEPFNEAGWRRIVDVHGGKLPLRIRAVPEGSVVPTHQALVTIESTDDEAFWLPSYLETLLLRLWYPVTVATVSWQVKKIIKGFLDRTSDEAQAQLPFKLHDFGARGVSSLESAALGGMAHLVNFKGTDTVSGVLAARRYYHEEMAGYSIPAAEHSTITSWGREHELDFYVNEFEHTGIWGTNYYACLDLDWELLAEFHGTSVSVPALFIGGDRDIATIWGREAIALFDTTVPRIHRAVVLTGCGHWTQQERPAETNAALLEFFATID